MASSKPNMTSSNCAANTRNPRDSRDVQLVALKLGTSMPGDAVYPTAWTSLMAHLPEKKLNALATAMGAPENPDEYYRTGIEFMHFVRKFQYKQGQKERAGKLQNPASSSSDSAEAAVEAAVIAERRLWYGRALQKLASRGAATMEAMEAKKGGEAK